MKQSIELYEKKVIQDKEFPIQMHTNCRENLTRRSQVFPPHWHEHLEMHYVLSGEMELMLDQETFTVREGQLIVANSNVLHGGYCDHSVLVLVLIFAMEDMSKELAAKNMIFQNVISGDPFIREIMEDLHREYMNREDGFRMMCKGQILRLITYMARCYVKETLTDRERMKHIKQLERFNTVRQYIENHYAESISNAQLAELIHLSEDRFNHLFKECMGISPLQYMNDIRLKKAVQLLKAGEYSSTEVAEMVGFTDYNHFGRLFRRTYGCTPTKI